MCDRYTLGGVDFISAFFGGVLREAKSLRFVFLVSFHLFRAGLLKLHDFFLRRVVELSNTLTVAQVGVCFSTCVNPASPDGVSILCSSG